MPKGITTKSKCPHCFNQISLFAFSRHVKTCNGPKIPKKRVAWNKGLSADIDSRVEANRLAAKKAFQLNPREGVSPSLETRQKISIAMKRAHEEGRAWNIGKSRWNNEPSWPEKFFMEVIENEFSDKNYITEFPFHRYAIDFAWVEKKKAIEIDGDQHQRFEEYKIRDAEKDRLLKEVGWEVLRIPWKDFYANTKKWIAISKDFIGT